MRKQSLNWCGGGALAIVAILIFTAAGDCTAAGKLFPDNVVTSQWAQFTAEGFSKPACGVVYRTGQNLSCGMPLGTIDTGCIDMELDGTMGYCTIYNSHVPRRGKMNLPYLGLVVENKLWALATSEMTGVAKAKQINYWGHYPILDVEYDTDAPVSVGMRTWTVFIVGDEKISSTPAAMMEIHLCNDSATAQKGAVLLSWPGPTNGESGSTTYQSTAMNGTVNGIVVSGKNGSLAVGAIGKETMRIGGSLGADAAKWAAAAMALPTRDANDSSATLAVDFDLPAKSSKVIRFVAAWHFPEWKGGGTNDYLTVDWGKQKNWYTPDYKKAIPEGSDASFTHMYAKWFKGAADAAEFMARNHETLLKRIIAWQEVVYGEESLPVWLRESLVNNLHLITEDGMWAQAKDPVGKWCKEEDGLFGMNECPRECPQIECIPCSFYGNMPVVYFFPRLAMSTMRGYISYMTYDGAAPWIFGGCTARSEPTLLSAVGTAPCAMHLPCRGYQVTTNGISFSAMADRLWMCSGYDEKVLKELYPWVKKNMIYTISLSAEDGADGVVSMPTGNIGTEWFEHCEWKGITAHVGALHLAQLRIAERMADRIGDKTFRDQCRQWFRDGSKSMEANLWNGKYYVNFYEPKTGAKSDMLFSYQLDGEWITDFHGLPYCLPEKRVKKVLDTVRQMNAPLSQIGALSFVQANGKPAFGGQGVMKSFYDAYDFFVPELLMLSMNYMYEGQKEIGTEWARRCMESIVCKHLYTWDMPNMIRGDTGKVAFGKDYYQMMMLWSLPAALTGQDMAGPVKDKGLVSRMIKASRE